MPATHGYLPLLGSDESVSAQIGAGVAAFERHLGKKPRAMWVPECGYRPSGMWQPPVAASGDTAPSTPFPRKGVEEALAEAGLDYFFVDTHLVEESMMFTPYQMKTGERGLRLHNLPAHDLKRKSDVEAVFRPYVVDGPSAKTNRITVFPRDPKTGLQVWSGDTGYPADGNYLDFHKKRWPGGHRYWQVTLAQSDMALKAPYIPEDAQERARVHAEHFVGLVVETLQRGFNLNRPPIMSSLFDAELFGHWWFEGADLAGAGRSPAREGRQSCPTDDRQRLSGEISSRGFGQTSRRFLGQERQQRGVAQRRDQLDVVSDLSRRASLPRDCQRRTVARWRLGGADRETTSAGTAAAGIVRLAVSDYYGRRSRLRREALFWASGRVCRAGEALERVRCERVALGTRPTGSERPGRTRRTLCRYRSWALGAAITAVPKSGL